MVVRIQKCCTGDNGTCVRVEKNDGIKVDPGNHTRWKHKWESGTNRRVAQIEVGCGTKLPRNCQAQKSGAQKEEDASVKKDTKGMLVSFALGYVELLPTDQRLAGRSRRTLMKKELRETGAA